MDNIWFGYFIEFENYFFKCSLLKEWIMDELYI